MSAIGGVCLGGSAVYLSEIGILGIRRRPTAMPTLSPSPLRDILAGRVASVEERVRAACARAGRPRKSVTLVAVTKYVGPTLATLVTELGVFDLGESRPQELWKKHKCLPPAVRWHLVGHLQRNKIERTLPLV